jgi:hypothetical protein
MMVLNNGENGVMVQSYKMVTRMVMMVGVQWWWYKVSIMMVMMVEI